MNFFLAREYIREILNRNNGILRFGTKDRGVVGSILWKVSKDDSIEAANGLIRLFDLYMVERGSFNWFDGEGEYNPLEA